MGGSERRPLPPVPSGDLGGRFTQKEIAVISALMDYLGYTSITYREALGFLALMRKLHDQFRAV